MCNTCYNPPLYGYGFYYGLEQGQGSIHNGYVTPCTWTQNATDLWANSRTGNWCNNYPPYPTIPTRGFPQHYPYYIPAYSGIPMEGSCRSRW